jgi:DNA-binding PadR family transcriptional regulator
MVRSVRSNAPAHQPRTHPPGILAQESLSGYSLRKRFATTPFGHFSDSPGSIYPALQRLQRRGLLRILKEKPANGRRVQRFTTTPKARGELRRWLHRPPSLATKSWQILTVGCCALSSTRSCSAIHPRASLSAIWDGRCKKSFGNSKPTLWVREALSPPRGDWQSKAAWKATVTICGGSSGLPKNLRGGNHEQIEQFICNPDYRRDLGGPSFRCQFRCDGHVGGCRPCQHSGLQSRDGQSTDHVPEICSGLSLARSRPCPSCIWHPRFKNDSLAQPRTVPFSLHGVNTAIEMRIFTIALAHGGADALVASFILPAILCVPCF